MREAILRPELRENKEIERFRNSKKSANAPGAAGLFRAFMNPPTSGGKSSDWNGRASLFSRTGPLASMSVVVVESSLNS